MTTGRIKVYVQPRSSKSEVVGLHGDAIRIRVAAPPVDDAANEALRELIAARLGVAKRCVRVIAGWSSRRKVVEVEGLGAEVSAMLLKGR